MQIKEEINEIRNKIINLRKYAEENKLLNSQEYIEFEDFINEISVMDPTSKI